MGQLFYHRYVLNRKSRMALTGLSYGPHHFQKPTFAALIDQVLLAKDSRKATKLVIEDIFVISLKNGVDGTHRAQLILKKGLT